MSNQRWPAFVKRVLTCALIMTIAALLAPLGLINTRGQMLRGMVGAYSYTVTQVLPGDNLSEPVVTAPSAALPNEVVEIGAQWNPTDLDAFAAPFPAGFPDGVAEDTVTGSWSDGGAGGSFGYLDPVTSAFTTSSDPALITHYRTPNTSADVTWVELAFTIDDTASIVDPVTGVSLLITNDTPATGKSLVHVAPLPPDYITLEHPEETDSYLTTDSVAHDGHWVGVEGRYYFQQVWVTLDGGSWSLWQETTAALNEDDSTVSHPWSVTSFPPSTAGTYISFVDLIKEFDDGTQVPIANASAVWDAVAP